MHPGFRFLSLFIVGIGNARKITELERMHGFNIHAADETHFPALSYGSCNISRKEGSLLHPEGGAGQIRGDLLTFVINYGKACIRIIFCSFHYGVGKGITHTPAEPVTVFGQKL